MDIDMLRTGKADQATLLALVKDCATLDVAADGLHFIADSAVVEEITTDSEYKGTRILMDARMDNVRLKIQIDFGVGDVMVPGPRMIDYPVFLGVDTIELLAYPIETAIAEKRQAMVALGNANRRMKDFYDVWICSTHLDLNGKTLLKAINATFKNRQTPVPAEEFEALSPNFVRAHTFSGMPSSTRWARRILPIHLVRFEDLIVFAMPAFRALTSGENLAQMWKAGAGWV